MTRTLVGVALVLAASTAGYAQAGAAAPTARVEVEVGGGVFGGARLGARDANLRSNAQAPQPYRLFTADSRLASTPSLRLRTAVPLGRRLAIEGGLTWGRPEIRTSLTADAEGAASITSVERIDQYAFDVSLVWMLDALRVGERLLPFVSGGGGYLRQLHEGRTLVEHGQVYRAGGGVRYRLMVRPEGFVRSMGLRADALVEVLRGGIAFEDRPRSHAAISGGLYVGF